MKYKSGHNICNLMFDSMTHFNWIDTLVKALALNGTFLWHNLVFLSISHANSSYFHFFCFYMDLLKRFSQRKLLNTDNIYEKFFGEIMIKIEWSELIKFSGYLMRSRHNWSFLTNKIDEKSYYIHCMWHIYVDMH